jgi:hypothetical protein
MTAFETSVLIEEVNGLWDVLFFMGRTMANRMEIVARSLNGAKDRQMKSAFETFRDHLTNSNQIIQESRISFAEEIFQTNSQPYSQAQEDELDTRLLAYAHFGLGSIAWLHDDYTGTLRQLLNAFVCEPRLARKMLAPRLYEVLFRPQIQELESGYEERECSINDARSRYHWKHEAQEEANVQLPAIPSEMTPAWLEWHLDEQCRQLAADFIGREETLLWGN